MMRRFFIPASILIAAYSSFTASNAQTATDSKASCAPGTEMTDKQLQGEWIGSISGQALEVRIFLGPHPEWAGTVKGSIQRPGSSHPMVGDVDHGTVTLEESADGTHITGTWFGDVVPGSCAREIRGNFQAGEEAQALSFVLR